MSLFQAVNLGIKYSFSVEGRASRAEYWYYHLFCTCVFLSCFNTWGTFIINAPFVVVFVLLILQVSLITAGIRRLHDINRSGWWWLLTIIPFGFIVLFFWYCQRGCQGENNYGMAPFC